MSVISVPSSFSSSVVALNALEDNMIWLWSTGPKSVAVVDPGEDEPVTDWLERHHRRLTHILLTHHHADHTSGVAVLQRRYRPLTIGAHSDRARLPPLDITVRQGDLLSVGKKRVKVEHVPGHTSGHVVYCVDDALFSGDTLFSYGCGRIFEGTPEQMWCSLKTLRTLPDATRLFAAHEYTLSNLRYAIHLEPNSTGLKEIFQKTERERNRKRATLPGLLSLEKQFNPFLRCDQPSLKESLGLPEDLSPESVFARLRALKDRF